MGTGSKVVRGWNLVDAMNGALETTWAPGVVEVWGDGGSRGGR